MWRSLFSLIVLVLSCFSVLACSSKGEQASGNRIDLEIQQVGGDVGWTATWRLTAPADGIAFTRRKDRFRHRAWKPLSQGTEIIIDGDREILLSDQPRTEFRIHFPSYPFEVYDDYPLVMPYSDGGAVLYLAHFYARPINCAKAGCPQDSLQEGGVSGSSIRLRSGPNGSIVVKDRVSYSDLQIESEPEVFAYIGPASVQDFQSFRAILDPELPPWVLRDLTEQMPRLLALYAEKMRIALPASPLIFFARPLFDNKSADGVVGAVNQSQMMLSLQGTTWNTYSEKNREEFLRLMAHESFHLWNANLYSNLDRADAIWLHEGSAEAMSLRSLLDLGLVNQKRFLDLQTEALNRCIVGRDMRLPDGREPLYRQVRTQYFCGSMIFFLLQGLQAKRGEGAGAIYKFWSEVFNKAQGSGGIYSAVTFFSSLGGVPSEVEATLSILASGLRAPSEPMFRKAWGALSVAYDSSKANPPFWYRKLMSQRAIEGLLDRDCGGPGYYIVSDKDLELIGSRTCHTVRAQRHVRSIEGFPLFSQGVQAYDYLRDACRDPDSIVNLTHDKGYLSLRCGEFPQRPPYLRLDEGQINQLMFR